MGDEPVMKPPLKLHPKPKRAAVHWSLHWAARFIAKWEGGPILLAYLDKIAVPPVLTIAFGHTGSDVRAGMRITVARAYDLLIHDIRWAAQVVDEKVKVPLTVRQRMALISIVFNAGPGVLEGTHLIHDLNRGDYKRAADRFLEWDHAGGVVVEGLRNRREAERAMFLHSKPR